MPLIDPGPLESRRLLLRRVEAKDLADLGDVNGDEAVTRFLPYATWRTPDDGASWFDRMEAIGKGVLGLTIQCAQCHTHKFDPIKQTEYYGLMAFLNNDYEATTWVYSDEQLATMLRQYEEMLSLYGTQTGVNLARKHIGWYTKGLPGSAELRNRVNQQDDPAVVVRMLQDFYSPWLARSAA